VTTIDLGRPARAPIAPAIAILVAATVLTATVVLGRGVAPAAGLLVVVAAGAVGYRLASRWETLIGITVLVVLFIPIKRYKLAVDLPFDLEIYRIMLAGIVTLWVGALLADRATRLRGTPLDAPLGLFALSVVASVVTNPEGIQRFSIVRSFVGDDFQGVLRDADLLPYVDVSSNVVKELAFLASFFLAFYLIVGVIRSPAQIETVVKTLVAGGAVVAALAVYERRTGYNVFDHLEGWVPLVNFEDLESGNTRSGRLRVLGSAQHPIALAAMLVMLAPLSIYLGYRTRQARWWVTTAVLVLAPLATVSRTAMTMALAVIIVFAFLRPAAVRASLPFALPFIVAVHLVTPGAIGGLRAAFFPSEGIVADQTEYGGRISARRLGPQFDVIGNQPAFGQGYGTRVTAGPNSNARILDDQWLATAVETGLVGVAAWVWLFWRFTRRAGRAAKEDRSPRGWLLVSLAAPVVGFAVGMVTFDAFSFIQVTFVFYVLLALGCATLAWEGPWPSVPNRAAVDSPRRASAPA
jgi:polysaccharide biosynthesis protein PslJ